MWFLTNWCQTFKIIIHEYEKPCQVSLYSPIAIIVKKRFDDFCKVAKKAAYKIWTFLQITRQPNSLIIN